MVSGGVQDAIQEAIIQATPEQLHAMQNEADAIAQILAGRFHSTGNLNKQDYAEFQVKIEILVRIEGAIKGKGVIWRALRRITLAREYLKN